GESRMAPDAEVAAPGRTALLRALELDPECGRCMSVLGWAILRGEHDWQRAEDNLRRGYDLDPDTGCIYAFFLSAKRKTQQPIQRGRRALRLAPANPATHSDVARMYHFARRYDEAIASFHKAMDLSPGNPYPNSYVSMSYLAAGQPDDAFSQWAPWVTRPGRP